MIPHTAGTLNLPDWYYLSVLLQGQANYLVSFLTEDHSEAPSGNPSHTSSSLLDLVDSTGLEGKHGHHFLCHIHE
jgi:hypothetical protein